MEETDTPEEGQTQAELAGALLAASVDELAAANDDSETVVPVRVWSCSCNTSTSLAMLAAASSIFVSMTVREAFSSSEQLREEALLIFSE